MVTKGISNGRLKGAGGLPSSKQSQALESAAANLIFGVIHNYSDAYLRLPWMTKDSSLYVS